LEECRELQREKECSKSERETLKKRTNLRLTDVSLVVDVIPITVKGGKLSVRKKSTNDSTKGRRSSRRTSLEDWREDRISLGFERIVSNRTDSLEK